MRVLILAFLAAACSQAERTPPPEEAPAAQSAAESGQQANLARMPAWGEARAAGVDFRGVGQEPGWMIDIYQQQRIVLLLDYGETIAEFPLPEPSYPVEGTVTYDAQVDGRVLSVSIRRFPCQDSMSGENYPATVEVTIDRRTLSGCGRSV